MRLRFWGVRGSYAVAGPSTLRYGGNTSCVEIIDGAARLVVDAGSGLRELGRQLPHDASVDILVSHAHWDHVQGLPFFPPAHSGHVRIYGQASAMAALAQLYQDPQVVATTPSQLAYEPVAPGRDVRIAGMAVLPVQLNHPAGSIGYRVAGSGACAYISDTAPFSDVLHGAEFLAGVPALTDADRRQLNTMRAQVVAALADVHTVIYDTQYTQAEYAVRTHYGHSTPNHALEICAAAGVKRLVLFHHSPERDDAELDSLSAQVRRQGAVMGIDVVAAYEGLELMVPS